MPKPFQNGLVLSGGGARGIAHLGVLKALFEKGFKPDIISGVSAGAIVGVFIADGRNPEDVFRLIKDKKLFNFSKIQIPRNGLMNLNGLKEILEKEIHTEDIRDLKIPMVIGATNMTIGRMEYFEEGPLSRLVQASAAIPVLFAPVRIGDYLYSDGGIFDNLPVTPLCDRCENVVAVHVNPFHRNDDLDSIVKMATRTFLLNVNETIKDNKEKCNIFIEPDKLDQYEILGVKKADELFEIGYEYTRQLEI